MIQKDEVQSAPELAREAANLGIASISARTAENMLKKAGFNAYHMQRRPLLTKAHKKKRIEFARQHQNWTVEQWQQVIFSDDTIIAARPADYAGIKWAKPTNHLNPRLIQPTVKGGGPSIMIWACISRFGFHDVILLDGTVTAEGYISVLKDGLLPVLSNYFNEQSFIFQQDGASVHTARVVADFLQSQNISVLSWPPNSPDLNIIEHVWYYVKKHIEKFPVATSKDNLWELTKTTLEYMCSAEMTANITSLFESLPNRMKAVLQARGGNTKY